MTTSASLVSEMNQRLELQKIASNPSFKGSDSPLSSLTLKQQSHLTPTTASDSTTPVKQSNNASPANTSNKSVPEDKTSSDRIQTLKILSEIVFTETTYVESLESVLKDFLDHLEFHPEVAIQQFYKQHPSVILLHQQLSDIVELHRHFLYQLKSLHLESDNSYSFAAKQNAFATAKKIAQAFISNSHSFKLYKRYASHHQEVMSAFADSSSNGQVVKQFIGEYERQSKKTLQSILITPIQRLPRYSLLLRELLKSTSKVTTAHDANATIQEAATAITNVATAVNTAVDAREGHKAMQKLNDSFNFSAFRQNNNNFNSILKHNRTLLYSGPVTLKNKKKIAQMSLHLMNDVLLVSDRHNITSSSNNSTTISSTTTSTSYRLCHALEFHKESIMAFLISTDSFQILGNEQSFVFSTVPDAQLWVNKIQDCAYPVEASEINTENAFSFIQSLPKGIEPIKLLHHGTLLLEEELQPPKLLKCFLFKDSFVLTTYVAVEKFKFLKRYFLTDIAVDNEHQEDLRFAIKSEGTTTNKFKCESSLERKEWLQRLNCAIILRNRGISESTLEHPPDVPTASKSSLDPNVLLELKQKNIKKESVLDSLDDTTFLLVFHYLSLKRNDIPTSIYEEEVTVTTKLQHILQDHHSSKLDLWKALWSQETTDLIEFFKAILVDLQSCKKIKNNNRRNEAFIAFLQQHSNNKDEVILSEMKERLHNIISFNTKVLLPQT